MRKRELLKRIEELEKVVAVLQQKSCQHGEQTNCAHTN